MEDNVTHRLLVDELTADPAPFGNPEDDFARHRAVISGMRDAGADDNAIKAYLVSQGISPEPWRGGQAAPMTRVAEAPQPPSIDQSAIPSPDTFAERWPLTPPGSYVVSPTIDNNSTPNPIVEAAKARQGAARVLSQHDRPNAVAHPEAAEPFRPAPDTVVRADHLQTSELWPVAPTPAEPGQGPLANGFYAAPVRRAPSWEQVVPNPPAWWLRETLPSATSWKKAENGIECYNSNGRATCVLPGGRQVAVGVPRGFPAYIGPGEENYHYYSRPDGPVALDSSDLMRGVVRLPTRASPQSMLPATRNGSLNEATPFLGRTFGKETSPVKSYLTTDQNGETVVVNVTEPRHPLYPGIVVRYVTSSPSGSTIQNEGTGLGHLQAPRNWLSATPISNVWYGQAALTGRGPDLRWGLPLGK